MCEKIPRKTRNLIYDRCYHQHVDALMNKAAEKLSPSQGFHEAAVQPLKAAAAKKRADEPNKSKPVIIKKYANRRLYNTETSSYVTLEDLGDMVRSERFPGL